jgi:phosphoglycerate kinase
MALDIGPKTLERFAAWLPRAKTVLWCGPLGAYKNPTFAAQTLEFARLLSEISGFGVVVGDDTLHALSQAQTAVTSRIGFVSTAGRSSLEVLEGRRLAGLEALRSGAT